MQTSPRSRLTRVRLGGSSAILTGLCYGAAGYLDRPGASAYTLDLMLVLSVAIPVFVLGGLLGLHTRLLLAAQRTLAGGVGFVLGCLGALLGIVGPLVSEQSAFSQLTEIASWWVPSLAGLTLMGLAALVKGGLRLLGTVVLISAVVGWISLLTDPAYSGVVVPMRPVHVVFAGAFCLSCVVWGVMLVVSWRLTRSNF